MPPVAPPALNPTPSADCPCRNPAAVVGSHAAGPADIPAPTYAPQYAPPYFQQMPLAPASTGWAQDTGPLHPRYPYYSYRRPWYDRGPASLNVTIPW
ncbi:MAG: hypothetical protein ACF8TS_06740 [Maioricimonas sp. JB049]